MASTCMSVQLQGNMSCLSKDMPRSSSRATKVQAAHNVRHVSLPSASCSSFFGVSDSRVSSLGHSGPSMRRERSARVVRSELAVELGGTPASGQVSAGSRVRVTTSVVVYHIPKVPEYNLEGLEGEVKEVLGEFKGRPISANLPLKVQFVATINEAPVKFIAHVQESEVEVL